MPAPCVGCRGIVGRAEHVEVPPEVDFSGRERLAPPAGAVAASVGEDLVVFAPSTRRGLVLDATAALVLTAFDGARPLSVVVDQLAAELGLPLPAVERDVLDTVARLAAGGLLLEAEEGASPAPPVPTRQVDHDRAWPVAARPDSAAAPGTREQTVRLAGEPAVVRTDQDRVADLLDVLVADLPHSGWEAPGRTGVAPTVSVARGASGDESLLVTADGGPPEALPTAEAAAALALQHLDVALIERASDAILLHAGAVERDGRVVVIAGQSGTGKSTLTAGLVQHGLDYVTDEVTVVDPGDHGVRPHPKALDLSPASVALLDPPVATVDLGTRKVKVPARSLGRVSQGGRVALVVILHDGPGLFAAPGAVAPEPLRPTDALVGLLPVTFEQSVADAARFAALGRLCEAVPVVRMPRAPLPAMVRAVEELLDGL